MKTSSKSAHRIRVNTTSSDSFILFVSIVFTVLISFNFNKFSQHGNYFLFYGFGMIFLFYFLKRELTKFREVRGYSIQNKKLLIMGNGKPGRDIAAKILHGNGTGINLVGIISDKNNFESDLKQLMEKNEIDEILISIENDNYKEVFEAIDISGKYGLTVKLCSNLFTIIHRKIQTENFYGESVIDVTVHKHVKYYNTLKRLIDIGIAIAALIILSPIIMTIASIIKLTSKGPVIYSQKRVGLNGRVFSFYKFRSMYTNEGEDEKRKAMMLEFMVNNKACKIIDENRITAVGRFIRKTSLDELPQLYNVIRGDMSIVGPRPCLWYEFEHYADWQKRRANAMPGCTGIWQVSGRSNVSFSDSIILDLYYLIKMSPMYDIKLILKTIPVMLFSRGGK